MKVSFISKAKKQAGLTLIESMAALAIFAVVVGGALALFGGASSSQISTQMTSDLSAIRSAVKSLYFGQGGYGTANLNAVLVNGKKVPTTMSVTAGTPPTITHGLNGTVTATGAATNFTITVTAVPTDVCLNLLSGTNGWNSVTVGSGTAITAFPITPDTASTQCSAAATNTIIFQST
ncbi:MAG: type 4 pilus major pilin [Polaromonas sp.]|uniref:type 4 pilus major pilin n=1 Tax=Polaromonas sp. TaxID=1869339 RepID=UPI0024896F98|nr:type 4 pilus major pilin [Polaromonas sp.]MDI1236333.1 type 4 pilus major pilin [Polaromonas sp.]